MAKSYKFVVIVDGDLATKHRDRLNREAGLLYSHLDDATGLCKSKWELQADDVVHAIGRVVSAIRSVPAVKMVKFEIIQPYLEEFATHCVTGVYTLPYTNVTVQSLPGHPSAP